MSLMRLLVAGKSVEQMPDESRYQLAEQGVLSRLEPSVPAETIGPVTVSPGSQTPVAKQPMTPAVEPAAGQRWFLGKRRARREAEAARRPVQRELALNTVKVVRNDLQDSDLEVVARPVMALAQPLAVQQVTPPPRGLAWWRQWPAQWIATARNWLR
ncbi:MAG: hypothetical protein WCO56_17890 [Verrucomicrobiota bacterium]